MIGGTARYSAAMPMHRKAVQTPTWRRLGICWDPSFLQVNCIFVFHCWGPLSANGHSNWCSRWLSLSSSHEQDGVKMSRVVCPVLVILLSFSNGCVIPARLNWYGCWTPIGMLSPLVYCRPRLVDSRSTQTKQCPSFEKSAVQTIAFQVYWLNRFRDATGFSLDLCAILWILNVTRPASWNVDAFQAHRKYYAMLFLARVWTLLYWRDH